MIKHYVNETGTDLVFDTGVLLATAAYWRIKYDSPSGIVGSWVGSAYSSYSTLAGAIGNYFVKYTLAINDFNESGEWEFQTFIGAIDGTWYGETVKMNVYAAFE